MDSSPNLVDYDCLRERVANLKLEQRKVSKATETAQPKQDGPRVAQINLLHEQEIKVSHCVGQNDKQTRNSINPRQPQMKQLPAACPVVMIMSQSMYCSWYVTAMLPLAVLGG